MTARIRDKLKADGFEEKLSKHAVEVAEAETISALDTLADQWEIPRLEFKVS